MKNVHTEHCCKIHGCKYGDNSCSVVLGVLEQSYPCEECMEDEIKYVNYSITDLKQQRNILIYEISLINKELKKKLHE